MAQRVLVTEKIADEGIEALKMRGYDVDVQLNLSQDDLIAIIPHYDAMIVRSQTIVDETLLSAAKNLKIIGRAGVTVDNIDIEAANEKDIIVCNAPTSNVVSTAEHTFALMLSCARKVAQANESVHDHKWDREDFMGVELYAKTLALFGLGRVGSMVAERAVAFGMHVVVYDPYCNPERATQLGVTLVNDMDKVLAQADFISIHLPVNQNTKGMFGPEEFSKMKTGVIFINTSRPAIIDMNSLADFVAARKIASCGVDVFDTEPCYDSPLHELDAAILTPHISALTTEAQIRSGIQIADYIWAGLEGSLVPTALTSVGNSMELSRHIAPYIPAANILGRMVTQINGTVPHIVKVKMMGNLAELDPTALLASVLEGMLNSNHAQCSTMLEVKRYGERHGIDISCSQTDIAGEYQGGIEVDGDGIKISTTVFGADSLPRITSLLGYKIDVVPSKNSIVYECEDQVGFFGKIGTILGEHGINISTMQIANSSDETKSLLYMNIDKPVDEDVIEEMRSSLDFIQLHQISL